MPLRQRLPCLFAYHSMEAFICQCFSCCRSEGAKPAALFTMAAMPGAHTVSCMALSPPENGL